MSQTITRALTLGAASLALAGAAYAGTAVGHADSNDGTEFLYRQYSHGWNIWDPAGHVAKAYWTCNRLAHANGETVANELYYANGPWTRAATAEFMWDAVIAICPWQA